MQEYNEHLKDWLDHLQKDSNVTTNEFMDAIDELENNGENLTKY